jgi:hypothetical protein
MWIYDPYNHRIMPITAIQKYELQPRHPEVWPSLVSCPINNLPCVIPIPLQREKESRFEIATPACHNTALRCAGTFAYAPRNDYVKKC